MRLAGKPRCLPLCGRCLSRIKLAGLISLPGTRARARISSAKQANNGHRGARWIETAAPWLKEKAKNQVDDKPGSDDFSALPLSSVNVHGASVSSFPLAFGFHDHKNTGRCYHCFSVIRG
jgi:hypothetical protein